MKKIQSFITIFILVLTVCTACQKPLVKVSADELLNLGEKYLLELDYEQAIVQFTKLIEIEPKNARAYTRLAEAYIGMGNTDKAFE